MKRVAILGAILIGIYLPVASYAAVLDFELGLPTDSQLPVGYGGFTWDPAIRIVTNEDYNNGWGNSVAFPSGNEAVFNGFGVLSVFFTGGPVELTGAYFSTWADNGGFNTSYSSDTVTIEGYFSGTFLGRYTYDLTADFQFYSVSFGDVDEVKIYSSGHGKWWIMDDLTFDGGSDGSAGVPEPGTLILLGSGLVALAAFRNRRRSSSGTWE